MYLFRDDASELMEELKKSMIDGLRVKADFLTELFSSDDWTYVIKAHALIEASVTDAILDLVGDTRLRPVMERLPLSDSQFGKIIVLKQLNILSDTQRRFIRWFSELRNSLVHKVSNVNFTFDGHYAGLDKNQRKAWADSLLWFADEASVRRSWEPAARKAPKAALFMGIFLVVSELLIAAGQSSASRRVEKLAMKATGELLKEKYS